MRRWSAAVVTAVVCAGFGLAASEPNEVRVDLHATSGDAAVEDLKPDEIELAEDGVRQEIQSFELLKVGSGTTGSQQRTFVVFFDPFHVSDGSMDARHRLVKVLDRIMGDEDQVALMHPDMRAAAMVFGKKELVLAELLDENWRWGNDGKTRDRVEEQWFFCYGPGDRLNEMQARRREKLALDALDDLVDRLRRQGAGRKAVLLVTDGWRLFGMNRRAAASGGLVEPGARSRRGSGNECDATLVDLALMDNTNRLSEASAEANRINVTFYPISAGGSGGSEGSGGSRSRGSGGSRSGGSRALQELAAETDGVAVAGTSDVESATRRIVADMSSYYLVTYTSTNTKTDGKFRTLSARVKRPGVQVRVRRGYRAPTHLEATLARTPAPPVPRAAPTSEAVSGILHRPDEMVNPVNLASLRHVVLWKRGQTTGRDYVATDDPQVRRTDRLRLEHATTAAGAATAQMLDTGGKPMVIPVQVSERPDPSGNFRWVIAEAVLAPLAPGEYGIELTIGNLKVNTLFEVVP